MKEREHFLSRDLSWFEENSTFFFRSTSRRVAFDNDGPWLNFYSTHVSWNQKTSRIKSNWTKKNATREFFSSYSSTSTSFFSSSSSTITTTTILLLLLLLFLILLLVVSYTDLATRASPPGATDTQFLEKKISKGITDVQSLYTRLKEKLICILTQHVYVNNLGKSNSRFTREIFFLFFFFDVSI